MRAFFAVRVSVHRFGEGRQDRFHPTVVTRRSFSRPEAPSIDRGCAALAPASRPAIAHPLPPGFPQWIAPRGFLGARPHGGCNQRTFGFFGSSSPLAPHGTPGRRIVRPRTWRAPSSDATFTHDCTSSGQAPVHRDPRAPFRAFAFGGRASLGQSRLSTSANETTAYGHIHARRVHARLEITRPLRGRMIPWRLPSVYPRGVRRRQRAAEARPKADSPRVAGALRRQPRCSHGPDDLERRARSLLGFLRTSLLLSRPSIPLSPTRCPRSLECFGRASRGPSRPVSRGERGRARHHALA